MYNQTTDDQLSNQKLIKLCNNLIKGKRTALKELANRNNISTTKADKRGAVVIIDVEDYVMETEVSFPI